MNLSFDTSKADGYSSNSQIARILTENWVKENSFCPNCGYFHLSEFENNRPVADFFCKKCLEEYELKSKEDHEKLCADLANDELLKNFCNNSMGNVF